jgi:hypothetical protein
MILNETPYTKSKGPDVIIEELKYNFGEYISDTDFSTFVPEELEMKVTERMFEKGWTRGPDGEGFYGEEYGAP